MGKRELGRLSVVLSCSSASGADKLKTSYPILLQGLHAATTRPRDILKDRGLESWNPSGRGTGTSKQLWGIQRTTGKPLGESCIPTHNTRPLLVHNPSLLLSPCEPHCQSQDFSSPAPNLCIFSPVSSRWYDVSNLLIWGQGTQGNHKQRCRGVSADILSIPPHFPPREERGGGHSPRRQGLQNSTDSLLCSPTLWRKGRRGSRAIGHHRSSQSPVTPPGICNYFEALQVWRTTGGLCVSGGSFSYII